MLKDVLLFILVFALCAAKDIYTYDASRYDAFNVPSHTELLLIDNYICTSGWIVFISPRAMVTAYCHVPLIEAIDPDYYARWLNHPIKPIDNIPHNLLIAVDTPWFVIGDCADTVYLCDAPAENATWSRTCENAVRATYHLCSNAVLTGINSKLPHWEQVANDPQRASYQIVERDWIYQPCDKCPVSCPTCSTPPPPDATPPSTESTDTSFGHKHPAAVYWIVFALMCAFAIGFAAFTCTVSWCIRRVEKKRKETPVRDIELAPLDRQQHNDDIDDIASGSERNS